MILPASNHIFLFFCRVTQDPTNPIDPLNASPLHRPLHDASPTPVLAAPRSYAHMFAIKDSVMGRSAPWVPSGHGRSR